MRRDIRRCHHLAYGRTFHAGEVLCREADSALPGYIAQGRSVLPVTIPLIGIFGFAYYAAVLFADLLKSLLLLTVGRFILPERDSGSMDAAITSQTTRPGLKQAFYSSWRGAGKTVPKILLTMVPATFAVFVFIRLGIFEYIARHLGVVSHYFPIPAEALPIVATRLISPVGAYTVAGGLLARGLLAGKDIVIALLVGSLLATVPNVRYLVPYYFGIFGPVIGTQLVIVSTVMRILVFAAIVGAASFFV
jgi:hypothetical protein